MDVYRLMERVLAYIDANLTQELSYTSLAQEFHYSPFYFHKIFLLVTGCTVAEYLRRRRLAVAAKKLLESNESVTDICFACGFRSIPTFVRLFRKAYGTSPKAFRKNGQAVNIPAPDSLLQRWLQKKEEDRMMIPQFVSEPKFLSREAFYLVGCEKYTKLTSAIGKAWETLKKYEAEIPNRVNPCTKYGFEDYSRDFSPETMQFYYMAAVQVSSLDNIPHGMTGKTVPASDYAVFTVKGCNANGEIGKAFRYIYDEWLPNSEYDFSDVICGDFEFYDERWDCSSAESEIDIYLPIRKKG